MSSHWEMIRRHAEQPAAVFRANGNPRRVSSSQAKALISTMTLGGKRAGRPPRETSRAGVDAALALDDALDELIQWLGHLAA